MICSFENQILLSFACLYELKGPCTFEEIPDSIGDTSQDLTSGNDVDYPYTSYNNCVELCLNASAVFPNPNVLVVEECWGFTMIGAICRLHLVVRPSYFDASNLRVANTGSSLFIKRCFAGRDFKMTP